MAEARCAAEHDLGPGQRPRYVRCVQELGHTTWGGSQQWRQMSWNDEGALGNTQMASAVDVLREFAATLPNGHHEKPGVIRAIEVLRDAGGNP